MDRKDKIAMVATIALITCIGPSGFLVPIGQVSAFAPLVAPTVRVGVRLD